MIVLAIIITSYLFWSVYCLITELHQEKYEEYFGNKLDNYIAITNWINISIIGFILFIVFVRIVYLGITSI